MPRNTIVVTDVSYNTLGSRVQMLTVNYDGPNNNFTISYNDNIKIVEHIFSSSTSSEIGTAKIAYNVTRRVAQQTIPIYDLSGSVGVPDLGAKSILIKDSSDNIFGSRTATSLDASSNFKQYKSMTFDIWDDNGDKILIHIQLD